MRRRGLADIAHSLFMTISRGTFVSADDKKKMQEVTIEGRRGEKFEGVEHWQPIGHTHVPMDPDDKGQAEVLMAFVNGSSSHPVVIATADRRNRPTNMEKGDVVFYDPRDNRRRVHFTKDNGMVISVPEDTKITQKIGNVTWTLSKDGMEVTGGHIKHDGKRIDSTHTHANSGGTGSSGAPEV